MLFSGHKNICNEQKEGGNGSRGAAIKGMVLVGNWIGRQKGTINCINVPFYCGKGSSNWTDCVQCGFRQKFFIKGKDTEIFYFQHIPTFIGPNKSAPPRINREETVSDKHTIKQNNSISGVSFPSCWFLQFI